MANVGFLLKAYDLTKDKAYQRTWRCDITKAICGCLNRATNCSSELRIPFDHNTVDLEKLQQDISTFVSKNLFGSQQILFGSLSEPLTSAFCCFKYNLNEPGIMRIDVRPLPLGDIVLLATPNTHNTAHSISFHPAPWIDALRNLSFEAILPHASSSLVVNEGSSLISGHCVNAEGEHRWLEYKMCDTLDVISVETISEDLNEQFAQCINAAEEEHPAELWIGVCDENNAVLGITAGEGTTSVKQHAMQALQNWRRSVFPVISPDDIIVTLHEVYGTIPNDWLNGYYYAENVPENVVQLAVRYFVGRCCYVADEDDGFYILYVDSDVFEFFEQYTDPKLQNVSIDEDTINKKVAQYVTKIKSKSKSKSDQTTESFSKSIKELNWTWHAPDDNLMPRRVALSIKIINRVGKATCVNKSGDYSVLMHDDGKTRVLSPFQIWLRIKPQWKGAWKSSTLCYDLFASETIRVMIAPDELHDKLLNALQLYTAELPVKFNIIIRHIDDVLQFVQRVNRIVDPRIIIVTAFECASLAEQCVDEISFTGCDFKTLMFTKLHDDMSDESEVVMSLKKLCVVDVCLMGEFNDLVDPPLLNTAQAQHNLAGIFDQHADTITVSLLKDSPMTPERDAATSQIARQWTMRETSKLHWIVVQSGYLVVTKQINDVFRMILEDSSNKVYKVKKMYPGSGATSMLCMIGWQLYKQCNAVVCHLTVINGPDSKMTEFWKSMKDRIGNSDVRFIFLVDEGSTELCTRLNAFIHIATECCVKATVVQVISDKSPCDISVVPHLTFEDMMQVNSQLCAAFPSSKIALDNLTQHCKNNPDERENFHIYMIIHTATTGKFKPTREFFADHCSNLNFGNLNTLCFLAFLSAYCTKRIAIEWSYIGQLECSARQMISCLGESVTFMHPYLAPIFLEILAASRNIATPTGVLMHAWQHFSCQLPLMAFGQVSLIINALLGYSSDHELLLLTALISAYRNDDDTEWHELMKNIFENEIVVQFIGESFLCVARSEVLQKCNLLDESIHYAERAYTLLYNHSNRATSNLAESYGSYAVRNRCDAKFQSMLEIPWHNLL